MATKLRKAKRAAPASRTVRKTSSSNKTSRSSSKMSARRRLAAAKAKPKPKAKAAPRKQTFVASHLNPNAFEGGLRSYAKYRCRSGTITTSNFR
jgi:Tfp pilus assembly protein FimV